MGVARGQAEEAGENRESLQPASTAGIQIRVDKEEYIGLRWAAAYWKARHGEAVQREADLKRDNEELRARIRELEGRLYRPCCMDHPEGCLIMVFFNTGDNLDAT